MKAVGAKAFANMSAKIKVKVSKKVKKSKITRCLTPLNFNNPVPDTIKFVRDAMQKDRNELPSTDYVGRGFDRQASLTDTGTSTAPLLH